MAIEEQTNNLNSFSYEGAGKVYETLATNAAGEARAAGEAKTTALAEHRRASNTAANFRNAAGATQSKANQVLNAATESLNAASSRKAEQDNLTSISISTSLAKVGEHYLSAKVDADTLQGTINGMKRKGDLQALITSDPDSVITEIETNLEALQRDPNNPYLRSYIKQIGTEYIPARSEKEAIRVNANLDAWKAYVELAEGNISTEERNAWGDQKGMNRGMLKDVEYTYNSERAEKDIAEASNTVDGVNAALKEWTDFREEKYNNVHWVKSKSDETHKAITEADTKLNAAYKNKMGQIKVQSTNLYNAALLNPLDYSDGIILESIKGMQGSQQETINKVQKIAKAKKEAENWAWYAMENADSRGTEVGRVPEEKKELYEKSIANDLLYYVDKNDLNSIEGILNNRSEYISKFKGEFFRIYNASNDEDKAKMGNTVALMVQEKNGRTQMGQLLGPKELTEMLIIDGLAGLFKGDYEAAEKLYNDTAGLGAPLKNDEYNARIAESTTYEELLYKAGNRDVLEYKEIARRIALARPAAAKELIKQAYENYNVLVAKEDQSGFIYNWGGIVVDKTLAPASYESDTTDEGKVTIRNNILEQAQYMGVTGSRISFLPGNKVAVEDPLSGTKVIFPYDNIVKQYNRNELVTASLTTAYNKGLPKKSNAGFDINKHNQKFLNAALKSPDYTEVEVMRFMNNTLGTENPTESGQAETFETLDRKQKTFLDGLRR